MPQTTILTEKDTLRRNTQYSDTHTFRQTALFSCGNIRKQIHLPGQIDSCERYHPHTHAKLRRQDSQTTSQELTRTPFTHLCTEGVTEQCSLGGLGASSPHRGHNRLLSPGEQGPQYRSPKLN